MCRLGDGQLPTISQGADWLLKAVSQMGRRAAHNRKMTEFDPPTAYQNRSAYIDFRGCREPDYLVSFISWKQRVQFPSPQPPNP